jgi:hypothetical protein
MLLVTARHRVTIRSGSERLWRPYGPHHARRVGDGRTLCGLVAIEWSIFWDMAFNPGDHQSCPQCASLAASRGAGRVGPS